MGLTTKDIESIKQALLPEFRMVKEEIIGEMRNEMKILKKKLKDESNYLKKILLRHKENSIRIMRNAFNGLKK